MLLSILLSLSLCLPFLLFTIDDFLPLLVSLHTRSRSSLWWHLKHVLSTLMSALTTPSPSMMLDICSGLPFYLSAGELGVYTKSSGTF